MLLVTVASVHTVKASFNVLFALNKKLMYCVCVCEREGGWGAERTLCTYVYSRRFRSVGL